MRVRKRWLFAAFVVVLVTLAAAAVPALPHIVRILAIARIQATTHRPATIESLTLDLRRGLLAIRGVRLTDHDGQPLATIGELDARIRLRSLLRGHLWLRDLSIKDSTVRVVRFDHNAFNISDLVGRSGGGTALDVTVDRFTLEQGTVILEDRSLSPWRGWKSEALAMAARNVSTRRDDGEAQAASTINGAPVSVSVEHLRLYPIHLQAVVRARQVDLAVVRLYLPADAAVVLDRGRLDTTVTVALDARAGVRVDAEGQITDAMLIRRQQRDAFLIAPDVRVAVRDFSVGNDGRMAVGRIDVDGASTLINTDA